MRPPQNAGGIVEHLRGVQAGVLASMRPPQNAGGIEKLVDARVATYPGFNEAPAKRGGD